MEQEEKRRVLPVIPLRGICVLPGMITNIDINRKTSLKALDFAVRNHTGVLLITQRQIETEENSLETLYSIGCVAKIVQVVNMPNQIVRVVVEGLSRAHMDSYHKQKDGSAAAEVSLISAGECVVGRRGRSEGACPERNAGTLSLSATDGSEGTCDCGKQYTGFQNPLEGICGISSVLFSGKTGIFGNLRGRGSL